MPRAVALDDVTGGSLNSIRIDGDCVVKSYSGTLDRGYQKLKAEYAWLQCLPPSLIESFAQPIQLRDDSSRKTIELHLRRLQLTAVTKATLGGTLSAADVGEIVTTSLHFLLERLYPVRSDKWRGFALYESFHHKRITLAKKYLQRIPYMGPVLNCKEIAVNGVSCPSVNQFLLWLDRNHHKIYADCNVVAIHGNFHLDNILVTIPWSKNEICEVKYIDPRGDLYGPPHADLAKVFITLEAFYDEIHYGRFTLEHARQGARFAMNLQISSEHDAHYLSGLAAAVSFIERYAHTEGVSVRQFLRAMLVTECIHILSFSFYHAYRADTDPNRIRAFLAVFALLARRLMEDWHRVDLLSFDRRIL